jgi:hypothetical protein
MFECFNEPFKFGDGTANFPGDFPNCLGYDYETQGQGLITANPEDSPMTLTFYTDDKCTVETTTGAPEHTPQRWMAAYRKVPFDDRRKHQLHCWEIEAGAEWNMNVKKAFKLKCGLLVDGRMGLKVEHYDDVECLGPDTVSEEVFFLTMSYLSLLSAQDSIYEVDDLLRGKCARHSGARAGEMIFWKFDRPMFPEDFPDCLKQAIDTGVRTHRPSMTSQNYQGEIKQVRSSPALTENGAQHIVAPHPHVLAMLLTCCYFTSLTF